jgi:hypothetical protein
VFDFLSHAFLPMPLVPSWSNEKRINRECPEPP